MYRKSVSVWLREVNMDLSDFNSVAASLTWKLATAPDETTSNRAMELGVVRNKWKNKVCDSRVRKYWLAPNASRMMYLLCRGPRFSEELSRSYMDIMGRLAQNYNSEICFNRSDSEMLRALNISGQCVYGEPDLEWLIKRTDLSAEQLKWIWTTWHNFVGPKIGSLYPVAVKLQNMAAQGNGYNSMAEVWQEELEISNLESKVFKLYDQIKPLYMLLHAVVRHKLFQKYGSTIVDPKGPIPIHLLGNMWGQDWSQLINLFDFGTMKVNLETNLMQKNWTVIDMVLRAEDMYTSLGLPKMTEKFWKYSKFQENSNMSVCHGTAANLYERDDFRMLLCAKVTMEDFYIVDHEMGHIEYYMAYQNQPAIFQDGSSSAFHESIGDAIMNGVMVPQHLYRLGLITDDQLFNTGLGDFLLLQQALSKIPELPYSLIIDKYRWDIFKGRIVQENYNKEFWDLNYKIRGVSPPETRGEKYFDAGAKFHVPDNTPYIRYFLAGFLQVDMFNSLCKLAVCGKNGDGNMSNYCPYIPLHLCDIYGSKKSGKKLEEMMSFGSSQPWTETLQILTGKTYITADPLLQYYQPMYKWLNNYINLHKIPVGW
ncbi:angiotensin-converting enzyme-like [Photinus pyralis]|nr:angiotensin-converting enzyme-like [Photinus pyralis]